MDSGAWQTTVLGVARVRHDWSDLALCILIFTGSEGILMAKGKKQLQNLLWILVCFKKKKKAKQTTLLPLPWEILPGWREINTGYSFISSLWVPHHHPQVLFPPTSSTMCPVLEFLYTNFCHSINSVNKTTAVSYCEVWNVPGELLQLASWWSRNQAVPSSTSTWGWLMVQLKYKEELPARLI